MLKTKHKTLIRMDLLAGYTGGRFAQVISLHSQQMAIWCLPHGANKAYRTDFKSEQLAQLALNRCITKNAELRLVEAHSEKTMDKYEVQKFCKQIGLDYLLQ